MKSLHDYLIQEKLHIGKDIKYHGSLTISFPVVIDCYKIVENEVWRTISLPDAKYVIFLDKYRFSMPHFDEMSDFIYSISIFEDDYEDFDPEKDILYSSNDINKVFEWYWNYLGFDKKIAKLEDAKKMDEYDLEDLLDRCVSGKNTCDSDAFFANMVTGDWDESNFEPMFDYADTENIVKNLKNIL